MSNQCNQPARPSVRSSKGFTLLEVMIALAILSVGLLGMAAMQTYANGRENEARYYTEANIMATQLLEGLMSLEFTDADLNGAVSNPGTYHDRISAANRANIEGDNFPDEGQYNYSYTVQNDQAGDPTYKIIRLQVVFSARSGQKSGTVDLTQLKPRAHEVK